MTKAAKAYITQQAEELRPFLTENGEVEVIQLDVQKEIGRMKRREEDTTSVESAKCCLLFKVKELIGEKDGQPEFSEIKMVGFGKTWEEAAKDAKEGAWKLLNQVLNEVTDDATHQKTINQVIAGGKALLH